MSGTAISELLGRAGSQPATYVQEVILLAVEYHAEQVGSNHPLVESLRRNARSLNGLIGVDAQQEWTRLRAQLPWWSRMLQPGQVPDAFKADFIELQRSRARTDFIAARRAR